MEAGEEDASSKWHENKCFNTDSTLLFVLQHTSASGGKVRWYKGRISGLAGSKSQLDDKFAKFLKLPAHRSPGLSYEGLNPDDL